MTLCPTLTIDVFLLQAMDSFCFSYFFKLWGKSSQLAATRPSTPKRQVEQVQTVDAEGIDQNFAEMLEEGDFLLGASKYCLFHML